MFISYCKNLPTLCRTKSFFLVWLLLCLLFLPTIGSAQSYIVETNSGTVEVQVFSTHVEVTDAAGNVSIISTEDGGIVDLETFGASGGYTASSTDTSGITVSQEEQDAYDELMAGATATPYDDGSGGGGISPDLGIQGSTSWEPLVTDDPSIQHTSCFDAVRDLVIAAAGVGLGCGGPQAAFTCATALLTYVGASLVYLDSCTSQGPQ